MKRILLPMLFLISLNSMANEALYRCFEMEVPSVDRASILCAGVKTLDEAKFVHKCYIEDSKESPDRSAILCSGVRTQTQVKAVMDCYNSLPADGDVSAALCAGVKNDSEGKQVTECFKNALVRKEMLKTNDEKYRWDIKFISVLCAKSPVGAYLHLLNDPKN